MIQLVLFTFITFYCYHTVAAFALGSTNVKEWNESTNNHSTLTSFDVANKQNLTYGRLIRVRREDDGSSKFTQAAQMDQLKVLRLYLQHFKNLWDSAYIGGAHPLHPNVPKAIVLLWKTKIVEFFFPPVGEDAVKGK
ncbi:unnamed protein product [Pieris brassicae]|uniref:Uncharacterized protein n=1 Tax=Pieris brassicae TaxID=7116 RepID=A0A9P0TL90_PIEBR|nr:unnamed protein product [Pieris brassicae]